MICGCFSISDSDFRNNPDLALKAGTGCETCPFVCCVEVEDRRQKERRTDHRGGGRRKQDGPEILR